MHDEIIEEYLEIIRAVANAWNKHDIDGLLSHLDEDIYWDDPAMEKPTCGHDMLKEFALLLWRAFPDIYYEPLQDVFLSSDQTKLIHRFMMSGTMIGPLPPGFAPTGRKFEIDGFEMIEFRNKKIYQCITRIDGIDVAQQIGLLPPRLKAGTWSARLAAMLQYPIAWYLRMTARQK
jgi:predicted ester cyclase